MTMNGFEDKTYLSSTIKLSKHLGLGFQAMFNHANRIVNRMNYFYDNNALKMSNLSIAYMIPIAEQTSLQLGGDVGYTNFSSDIIINGAMFEKRTWSGGFGLFVKGKTWGLGLAVPNFKNDDFYSFISVGGRSAFVHTEKSLNIFPTVSLQTKAIYKYFQNSFYNGLDLHTMLLIKHRIGIGVWSQNLFSGNYTNNWLWMLEVKPTRSMSIGYSFSHYLPEIFGIPSHQFVFRYDFIAKQ